MPKAINHQDVHCDVVQNGDRIELRIHANPGTPRHYEIEELSLWADELRKEIGVNPESSEAADKLASAERLLRRYWNYFREDDPHIDPFGEGYNTAMRTVLRNLARILEVDLDA